MSNVNLNETRRPSSLHYLEIYASFALASADLALPDSGYSVG
jgi:hypothetical protein